MFFTNLFWQRKLLNKLIISFICILIPIYLLSFLMYNQGKVTIKKEINASIQAQVNFYLSNLQSEIERIKLVEIECLNDYNIGRTAIYPNLLDDITNYDIITQIQKKMMVLSNSSSYVQNAYVLFPTIERKITYKGLDSYNGKEYKKLYDASKSNVSKVTYIDNKPFIIATYPYGYPNEKNLFLIAVELSNKTLSNWLSAMYKGNNSGIIFFSEDQDLYTSPNCNEEISSSLKNNIKGQFSNETIYLKSIKMNHKSYMALYAKSNAFNATLCHYIEEDTLFKPLHVYTIFIFIITLIGFITVLIYSIYLYKVIYRPISFLAHAFVEVEKGNLDVFVEYQKDDEFKSIYLKFNSMVHQLKTLINQVYKQKILTQKAELKHLQSQINPHFLYNSFFLLSTFTKIGDYESAERLADQLGVYFKFTTRNSSDTVPLVEEIKHANIYTDIQAQRFGRRLKVNFEELPTKYENMEVPRLIVQPIIENSFRYGLEGKTMGAELHIYFEETEDYLKIIIEDNGSSIENEEITNIQTKLLESQQVDNVEITGLTNIHKRLKLFYDDSCGLTVSKGESNGLKVTINIALRGGTSENV